MHQIIRSKRISWAGLRPKPNLMNTIGFTISPGVYYITNHSELLKLNTTLVPGVTQRKSSVNKIVYNQENKTIINKIHF